MMTGFESHRWDFPEVYQYDSNEVSVYELLGDISVNQITPDVLSTLVREWRYVNGLTKTEFYGRLGCTSAVAAYVEGGFASVPYSTRFVNMLLIMGFAPSDIRRLCAMFDVHENDGWTGRTAADMCAIAALREAGADEGTIARFMDAWSDRDVDKGNYPRWHRVFDNGEFVRWHCASGRYVL